MTVFFTVVAFSFSCLVALVLFFLSFNKDEDDGGRFIILFGATVLLFAFVFYSNIGPVTKYAVEAPGVILSIEQLKEGEIYPVLWKEKVYEEKWLILIKEELGFYKNTKRKTFLESKEEPPDFFLVKNKVIISAEKINSAT